MTPSEKKIGTANAYTNYISGFVTGAAETDLTKLTEEKLEVLSYSCRQLEAACKDLEGEFSGNR